MVPELEIQAFWDFAGQPPYVDRDFGAIYCAALPKNHWHKRKDLDIERIRPRPARPPECRDDKQAEFVRGWEILINHC